MIKHPSFTVSRSQGVRQSPSMHWARGRRTPWTGYQSILGLKQACNRLHALLRCLKMSAHRRHVLSGSLAVRQMVLVFHSC